uniref:SFRICE_018180 n=1 Tax=Spodoptera frugiperda TaxID=7108 RepID=A0A2H1WW24_SPOFR
MRDINERASTRIDLRVGQASGSFFWRVRVFSSVTVIQTKDTKLTMEPSSEASEPKSPEKPSTENPECSVEEISSPLEEPQLPLNEAEGRLAEPPLEVIQGNKEPVKPEETEKERTNNADIVVCVENSRGPTIDKESSNKDEEISQPPEELVTASVTEATENIQRPPDVVDVTLTTENHSSETDNSTGPPKEIIRQKIEENETSRAPDVVLTNNTEQPVQQETAGCSKWISNECPETTATDDSQVPSTSREDSQVPSTSRDDSQVPSTSTAPEVCAVTASTASASAPRTPKRKNLRPASSRKKVPSTRAKIASIVRAWKKGQRRRRARERVTKNIYEKKIKREDIVNQQPFLQTPVQTLGAAGICGILTTPLPSLMEEDG